MVTTHPPCIWLLCVLLVFPLSSLSFADTRAQLEQAETLLEKGQYEQAEAIYKQILTDHPGTDYAFAAQKGLAIVYVRCDKPSQADAAIEKLRENYSNHPDFCWAVCIIGDNFRWKGIDEKARRMYQIAAEGISGSKAFWVKTGLAITSASWVFYLTSTVCFRRMSAEVPPTRISIFPASKTKACCAVSQ